MECKCGGGGTSKSEQKSALKAKLMYQACDGCGTIGAESLIIRGVVVARGLKGRRLFIDLTESQADDLYAQASLPETPPPTASVPAWSGVEVGETASLF